jgi:site-specific recombinase XerD
MTYENSEPIRALVQQFINERKYLLNVTPKTIIWHGCGFKAFAGALDSLEAAKQRVGELRERNVSSITVNSYLRCINAFWTWQEKDWKIRRLKEEQKILQTLSADSIRSLINWKPRGVNQIRAYILALVVLDCGLRASEVLSLLKDNLNFDLLTIKVLGKGNKERVIPFSAELRKHLWRYTRNTNNPTSLFVFGTKNNTRHCCPKQVQL